MANGNSMRITTGSLSFEGGVDSSKLPTIASEILPYGLKGNQVAWANNCTFRGGGIRSRTGYKRLCGFSIRSIFQGFAMYQPDNGYPYLIASIGGRFFQIRVDTDNSIVEITPAGDPNPANLDQVWMCQAEQFLIIQDGVSVPLVWDGSVLRRVTAMPDPGAPLPKIPVGRSMTYYQGRLWIANGREYLAGDIVQNIATGTAAYGYRDSILKMTEVAFLGTVVSFTVPTNAGNIVALSYNVNIDATLGQGQLFIFTRKAIYTFDVPVDRTAWSMVDSDTRPIQKVVQLRYGSTSDRSIVHVNGDIFYQSTDGVRSFNIAVRNFPDWGNISISNNEYRAIALNDRALLRFGSGIEFNNCLYQTCLPYQTEYGVAHRALMPLDFDILNGLVRSSTENGNALTSLPPAWGGVHEGLAFYQLEEGDFGGFQRAFAAILSEVSGDIEIWEMTSFDKGDNGDNRIMRSFETPSYNWKTPFDLKELETVELWVDQLFGKVDFWAYYRPDQYPCWTFWHHWQECAARGPCEEINAPLECIYPEQTYRQQYRATMVLPKPPLACDPTNGRPLKIGYSFQIKIVIKGYCEVRGFLVHALPRDKAPFEGLRCVSAAIDL